MAELKRNFDFKTAPIEEVIEYANVLLKLAVDTKNELEVALGYKPLVDWPDEFTSRVEQIHKKLIEGLHGLAQAVEE